ncbi:ferrochelatase [Echinicola pacifica]|uniref:Ferrochelatase n=1 Tax=Echinicola pacifica TaxID=346377 RepID=A0A918PTT7_9BACT|nr:ferrochelatase [Echinicola pacifica]GGZ22998.1 ferrochelatase [Echinicola pacifica]
MDKVAKIGVLLVNLGTPDSTAVPDVRKYLREFLMDERVIDIPFLSRWFLVNGIIAPFRSPKSAAEYRKVWTDRGSPLLYHTEDLRDKLRLKLSPADYQVEIAMRYQSPSIETGLEALRQAKVKKIIVLPLFPQYASATNGSVIQKVMEIVRKWQVLPSVSYIAKFMDHPLFLEAWKRVTEEYTLDRDYDAYLFSYHGIPERQITKASCNGYCQLNNKCCSRQTPSNQYCYRAQCFHTSRLLTEKLGLPAEKVHTSFQSRLGKDPWIQPYTEETIKTLAASGAKKVLAFSPAFVADCLETTVEVGEEYKEVFEEAGGKQWDLVPCLNSHEVWVDCVKALVEENS